LKEFNAIVGKPYMVHHLLILIVKIQSRLTCWRPKGRTLSCPTSPGLLFGPVHNLGPENHYSTWTVSPCIVACHESYLEPSDLQIHNESDFEEALHVQLHSFDAPAYYTTAAAVTPYCPVSASVLPPAPTTSSVCLCARFGSNHSIHIPYSMVLRVPLLHRSTKPCFRGMDSHSCISGEPRVRCFGMSLCFTAGDRAGSPKVNE
jgi:hypothetical protein